MKYIILSLNPGFDRWLVVNTPPKLPRVCRADRALSIVSGKGINVARVFAGLGFGDYTVLNLEGGEIGRLIAESCLVEGIKLENFPIAGENRINTTIIKEYEKDTMTYNEPGPSLSSDEAAGFLSLVKKRLDENPGAALVLSGAAPDGFDMNIYLELLKYARESGHGIMADVGGEWLDATLGGPIELLKINREEFALGFGFDGYADTQALGRFMAEREICSVVLTDGSDGSLTLDRDGLVRCTLASGCGGYWAVGSGDAFYAGYLYALSLEKNTAERMIFANACGIANTTVYGPCTFEAGAARDFEKFVSVSCE